jgi:hypothetical protein
MGMIDHYVLVSPGYFDALRVKLVAGRVFDARDDARGAKAVIVNETLARAVWGEGSALGKRIVPSLSASVADTYTVVGVISDVKNRRHRQADGHGPVPAVHAVPGDDGLAAGPVRSQVARRRRAGTPSPARCVPCCETWIRRCRLRRYARSMTSSRRSQSRPRFMTLVLTSFGGVSLLLAAVGIFGVISYSVAQRTRELGIRIALGAQARGVLRLVLGGALRLLAAGVVFGLIGAFRALTRFLSAFLFGVSANDPGDLRRRIARARRRRFARELFARAARDARRPARRR